LNRERDSISALQQQIISLVQEKEHVSRELLRAHLKPLAGQSFSVAGSLSSMTQDEAITLIVEAGGRIHSYLNKDVNYLLVGRSPGTKQTQAEKLGIECISEVELLKMLSPS